MNGSTLKALRSLLFFTQDEAAILIGGVSLRSWQYWEVDKRTIHPDVIDRVTSLIHWRKKAIETVELALGDMLANIPGRAAYDHCVRLCGRLDDITRP